MKKTFSKQNLNHLGPIKKNLITMNSKSFKKNKIMH